MYPPQSFLLLPSNYSQPTPKIPSSLKLLLTTCCKTNGNCGRVAQLLLLLQFFLEGIHCLEEVTIACPALQPLPGLPSLPWYPPWGYPGNLGWGAGEQGLWGHVTDSHPGVARFCKRKDQALSGHNPSFYEALLSPLPSTSPGLPGVSCWSSAQLQPAKCARQPGRFVSGGRDRKTL